jgi:hypothetical protein
MKRMGMGMMQRVVRLAVGSLCLLALMVHAVAAADPPLTECILGPVVDQNGVKGGLTANLLISNLDTQASHQYLVASFSQDQPQGVVTTVTLRAAETQRFSCDQLKTCNKSLWFAILSDRSGIYPLASVMLQDPISGFATAGAQPICFSLSQQ